MSPPDPSWLPIFLGLARLAFVLFLARVIYTNYRGPRETAVVSRWLVAALLVVLFAAVPLAGVFGIP
jgi:hypothetical protein